MQKPKEIKIRTAGNSASILLHRDVINHLRANVGDMVQVELKRSGLVQLRLAPRSEELAEQQTTQ